ncbi:uncharacterized protein LOC112198982 [Rosa chinensis]|uniref:uncharacterized protein LOC112198982 n=1 Tax=Rosa chinensis TaxID=74649 RepID=UPI001AD909D7|nr:uncharacterized protein LOC112198982 [Rosa chinensis]
MSISLSDLQAIGGLPISGVPYEEFLPTNKDLRNKDLYPPTVLELLQIHSALCIEYGYDAIYWDQWLTHFFRGELIYASPGEGKAVLPKPRTPRLPLRISEEGKLAAFLVFWLCRFVLPAWDKTIRPEAFHMACLMAKGVKVSIAPTTLGYIYHRLGEIASYPVGDVPPKVCLPIHYVLCWLGEYFPQLCKRRADSEFPADYPRLARYAYVASKDLSITCARMVFRDNKSVIYRPHAFLETEGCFLLDDETLSDERFEFLFGLRSACLPVRVDGQLILEPYYPNRFARQFGYDQSVPSNRLSFSVSKRKQCFVEDLARAQSILYRRNTTAQIYIPRSTREGECTWWYCKWWLKACIPYLGLSVSKTFKTFTQKSPEPDHRVFIVNKLAEVSADLRKEVQISSLPRPESQNSQTSLSKVGPNGDNRISSKHINHEKVATHKGTVSREVSLPQTGSGTQDAQKALKRKPDSLHPSNPSAAVRNVQQTESGFSSNTDPSRAEIVARTSKRQPVERQSNGRPQRA